MEVLIVFMFLDIVGAISIVALWMDYESVIMLQKQLIMNEWKVLQG